MDQEIHHQKNGGPLKVECALLIDLNTGELFK